MDLEGVLNPSVFFTSPNHRAEYVPSLVLYPDEISIPDNYVVSNPNTYCSKSVSV